ncbi:EspA/EspE family type VII secretion system effector [Mycobacterium dioxanotrophicus]|uniref:EspA/EspE family type VII secretion system effector n=1 Tax=Mycobacterium dioxanotrophicus TaxID=482462 RepID=UPI001E29093C|nr:EspA/EspE family type VII secretion system effector [Mycobacterium dioxanotrophicus]
MSALDAFYSTWDQARNTFGSGAPQTGAEFDRSSQLRDMQSAVQAATPDSRWQGSAADAYTAKNQKHAAVYGKLADLDQRMATEVDRSAAVVTAGRQNLDQVRDWVTTAAASAPNDKSGEYVKLAIASKGLSQISDIIQQSNSQMTAIGERVRGIGKEYDEIGGDDKKKAPDAKEMSNFMGPKLTPWPTSKGPVILDADDIKYAGKDEIDFNRYKEIVPGSGIYVPDVNSPYYKPHPPKHPINTTEIQPGPVRSKYMPWPDIQIGPDAWVPDPRNPDYKPTEPVVPLDLSKVVTVHLDPSNHVFAPYGYVEIGPDVWVPGPLTAPPPPMQPRPN